MKILNKKVVGILAALSLLGAVSLSANAKNTETKKTETKKIKHDCEERNCKKFQGIEIAGNFKSKDATDVEKNLAFYSICLKIIEKCKLSEKKYLESSLNTQLFQGNNLTGNVNKFPARLSLSKEDDLVLTEKDNKKNLENMIKESAEEIIKNGITENEFKTYKERITTYAEKILTQNFKSKEDKETDECKTFNAIINGVKNVTFEKIKELIKTFNLDESKTKVVLNEKN